MADPSPSPAPPGRPDDLRVRRTRQRLIQALIELVAERPLEAVTVRDLTAHAQVGYATFFRHYAGIGELLRAALGDLYADLSALLPPLAGAHPEQAGAVVFRHVGEQPGLYRLLLQADQSFGMLEAVVDLGVRGLLTTYEARPDGRVPPDLAADQFIRSFLNLIAWWLGRGMPYPPERMGEIYRDLILLPIEAVALQPRQASAPVAPTPEPREKA